MKSSYLMNQAIEEAKKASIEDEVPVGAIIYHNSLGIISKQHNMVYSLNDPTAHAEILALRNAASILRSPYLSECDIYVTLEPCAMCAQAISWSRINRLYFGASDYKSGGVENGANIFQSNNCHHKPEIYGGILEDEAKKLLKDFFYKLRQ